MFELIIEEEFSAAHRLRNYKGKCERLHGHNWKVQVIFEGEETGKDGLLMDFSILRDKVKEVIKILDHNYLNTIPFFKRKNPTSENISYFIFKKLCSIFKNEKVKVKKVTVWENSKQAASYSQD